MVALELVMFRSLFNHLELVALARKHEYRASVKSWRPYLGRQWGSGVMSIVLRFESSTGEMAFDVHAYITPGRTILGSGLFDPKGIYIPNRLHLKPASAS